MPGFRIGLRVPVGRPLPDLARFVARCEDAGIDGVGIHDHPSSGRDAYLALALAAQATSRIELFPATSSPVVRHPMVLASLAHSLDEIAPGRIRLTVAPGFISTRTMGKPRGSVALMRTALRDLHGLLVGEAMEFGPATTRLRNRSAVPTPVYLLAAGPRMIELAGEMADGAFLFVGLHSASIQAARHHLQVGAARAGRSLDGFRTVFVVTFGTRSRPGCWHTLGGELVCARPALSCLSQHCKPALAGRSGLPVGPVARSHRYFRRAGVWDRRCVRSVRDGGILRGPAAQGAAGSRGR